MPMSRKAPDVLREMNMNVDFREEVRIALESGAAALDRQAELVEALQFIVDRENLMFAECSDAEAILDKAKSALTSLSKGGN